MIRDPLHDAVRHALGPSIESTVVAGVSGGPDSMALFHALCELSRQYPGLSVIPAYFDHQLRANSEDDFGVIIEVASYFDVEGVYFDSDDVAARARAARASVEATGRGLRYAFFEGLADRHGASVIATGHTRDDQVETVLMRILRGADTRGLRGIAARAGKLVRPLLHVTHAETIRYCETHGVPYVIDPTNTDVRFFRNHVRHDVLPSLRRAYPGIDDALLRVGESAAQRFNEADRLTCERFERALRDEGHDQWRFSLDAFDGLEDELRLHLISCVLDRLRVRDVTRAHYRVLLEGKSVDLPGWHVRREHDGLVFTRPERGTPPSRKKLEVPGQTELGDWRIRSDMVTGAAACEAIRRNEMNVAFLAAHGPLRIRFARAGDRMRPFGMTGHKKLSDLFIDRKIPRRLRATTPVVESDGEILWVVGVAVSESARVHSGTGPVIQLTASRMEPQA